MIPVLMIPVLLIITLDVSNEPRPVISNSFSGHIPCMLIFSVCPSQEFHDIHFMTHSGTKLKFCTIESYRK